jgi:hypothetical protein
VPLVCVGNGRGCVGGVKTYAGIGSRQTPATIIAAMKSIAARLGAQGWTLRSGAARGADSAFEEGTISVDAPMEIYLPEPGWNLRPNRPPYVMKPSREAYSIAEQHHPAWHNVKPSARPLHARNVHQVLGADCKTPASFVLCWTPDGATSTTTSRTGGTGQAIRIAVACRVPVFNLANADTLARLARFAA